MRKLLLITLLVPLLSLASEVEFESLEEELAAEEPTPEPTVTPEAHRGESTVVSIATPEEEEAAELLLGTRLLLSAHHLEAE